VVDSSGYVKTLSTAGSPCGDGVGLSSAAAGTTVQVASYGTVSVYVDASGASAGDLAECSTSASYPGYGHDSGTTTSASVPLGTQIVGRFMTSVTGSGLASIQLFGPGVFGSQFPALSGDLSSSAGSTSVSVTHVDGVSFPATPSTNTVPVVTATNTTTYEPVPNSALANSSVTVNTSSPLGGGGAATALGSSVTLTCTTCTTNSSSLASGQILVGAGSHAAQTGNLTGDATTSGTTATTVASLDGGLWTLDAGGDLTATGTSSIITTPGNVVTNSTGPGCVNLFDTGPVNSMNWCADSTAANAMLQGNASQTLLNVPQVSGAVNYIGLVAATTTNAPQLSFTGTDTAVSGRISVVGSSSTVAFDNGTVGSYIGLLAGTVSASGGLAASVVTKLGAYTATAANFLIRCNATSGAVTITLPSSPSAGEIVVVKKTDSSSNGCTISGNGHDIDGMSSESLPGQYNSYLMQWDSTSSTWAILAKI
jgi:hypothetical protein